MQTGLNPFMLAKQTYVVEKGGNKNLEFMAQGVHAIVRATGLIPGGFNIKIEGEGQQRRAVVGASVEGQYKELPTPRLSEIKTKNSPLWQSDPAQQLRYFGVRNWCRAYAPEAIMGLITTDERAAFEEPQDITPPATSPVDHVRDALGAAEEPQEAEVMEPEPDTPEPEPPVSEPESAPEEDAFGLSPIEPEKPTSEAPSGSEAPPTDADMTPMVNAFAELGITQDQIEERMGATVDEMDSLDLANLRKIYAAIKSGEVEKAHEFPPPPAAHN